MAAKRRFFLKIQYRGSAFAGWQRQPGQVSVQKVLEEALWELCGKEHVSACVASGRTDSGVHALGQMVHVDIATRLPPRAFVARLDRLLPPAVYVTHVWEVDSKWHAIRSARRKHYRYVIYRHGTRSPIFDEFAWVLNYRLDIEKMSRACKHFLGKHDFVSFAATDQSAKTTVRELEQCRVRATRDWIRFDLIGTGFLKYMVRNIVGTIVDVGRGKIDDAAIPKILKARSRIKAGRNASPQGLYLVSVEYPPEVFL